MRHSGAQTLLYDASFAGVATPAADRVGVPAWDIASLGADDVEPVRTHVAREAEDTAVIFYTSGTTGPAQGRPAHPPQPGAELDGQRLRRQPDPARRRGDGLPAAVPHVRADGVDELHVPGRRDAAAAAALRRRRRDRADAPRARHAVLRRADDVRPAARGRPACRRAAGAARLRLRWRVAAGRGAGALRGGVRHHGLRGLRALGDLADRLGQPALVRHPGRHRRPPDLGRRGGGGRRDRRRPDRAAAGRQPRRDRDPRAQRVRGLPRRPGGDRGGDRRRLVPHRRHRHRRRRRLHQHRGPQEGPDHPRRLQRLPPRGRGGAGPAPGGGAGRGDRGARRREGRGDLRRGAWPSRPGRSTPTS